MSQKTGQTKKLSLIEALVSTAVGFVLSFIAGLIFIPIFVGPVNTANNLALTSIFTVLSIGRGYVLRRIFNLI